MYGPKVKNLDDRTDHVNLKREKDVVGSLNNIYLFPSLQSSQIRIKGEVAEFL